MYDYAMISVYLAIVILAGVIVMKVFTNYKKTREEEAQDDKKEYLLMKA